MPRNSWLSVLGVVATLWWPGSARAGDCDPVRLDAPGMPMHSFPVVDQGESHTCYAYAATQMVDAWRIAKGAPKERRISAIEAALGYKSLLRNESSLDWGRPCSVVDFLRLYGGCDERAVHPGFTPDRSTRIFSYLNAYRDLYQRMDEGGIGKSVVVRSLEEYLNQDMNIPSERVPERNELARLLEQRHPMRFLGGIVGHGCRKKGRLSVPVPRCEVDGVDEVGFEPLRQIHRILDAAGNGSMPLPVAVTYCSQVLTEGETFQGIRSGEILEKCHRHVSLVIGRRMRDNKCELLVRNTWGEDCSLYSDEWQCEKGSVWVDAKALAKNTAAVSFLKE